MTHKNVQSPQVRTRSELVAFLRQLRADLHEYPESWENSNLESFLEAAAAWVEDMDGYYSNRGEDLAEQPQWRTIADIFAAAKTYE